MELLRETLTAIAAFEAANQPAAFYAGLGGFTMYTWFIQYWFFENYFSLNWTSQPSQAILVRTNVVAGVVLTAWATATYSSVLVGLAVSVGVFIPLIAIRLLVGGVAR